MLGGGGLLDSRFWTRYLAQSEGCMRSGPIMPAKPELNWRGPVPVNSISLCSMAKRFQSNMYIFYPERPLKCGRNTLTLHPLAPKTLGFSI